MSKEFVMVPRELADDLVKALEMNFDDGACGPLEDIRLLLSKPADQRQGEPVAWRVGSQIFQQEHLAKMHSGGVRKPVEPLYTHSDPGEVERLRDEIDGIGGMREKLSDMTHARNLCFDDTKKLRAQLAERDALLREKDDVLMAVKEQFDRHGNSFPDRFDSRVFRWVNDAVASASAEPSAPKCKSCGQVPEGQGGEYPCKDCGLPTVHDEPSAPVEIDERAAFEASWSQRLAELKISHRGNEFYRVQPNDLYRWHNVQDSWEMWQARAALERKQ